MLNVRSLVINHTIVSLGLGSYVERSIGLAWSSFLKLYRSPNTTLRYKCKTESTVSNDSNTLVLWRHFITIYYDIRRVITNYCSHFYQVWMKSLVPQDIITFMITSTKKTVLAQYCYACKWWACIITYFFIHSFSLILGVSKYLINTYVCFK